MAEFIYNDFPTESESGKVSKSTSSKATSSAKTNNLLLIIVSAFFAALIITMIVMGVVISGKLDSSSGNQKVDSLIFSTPNTDSTPSFPTANPANTEFSSVSELVYSVKDSVVEIASVTSDQNDQYSTKSLGSGVIIGSCKIDNTPSGYYVVTNAHVIQNEYGSNFEKIAVITTDGNAYEAIVRGTDEQSDLAVLLILTTDSLKGASILSRASLTLGQEVVAIGTPHGDLGASVSNGIISSTEKEIKIDGLSYKLLQTNAIVASGNSGGGLFDMKGKLIGIINTRASKLGIKELGFATPSSEVEFVVNEIIEHGYVQSRPYLGATVSTITDDLGNSYVYIHALDNGYNSSALQVQDIILSLNGEEILSDEDYYSVLAKTKPSDTIDAYVKRGTEILHVTLTVYNQVH